MQPCIGIRVGGLVLFALGILLGTPPTKDVRRFPGKTAPRFDAGQLTLSFRPVCVNLDF